MPLAIQLDHRATTGASYGTHQMYSPAVAVSMFAPVTLVSLHVASCTRGRDGMSMSELYVDVNDTNTCSDTGTDAAPRMRKTDYHCQSHRSLGAIHSASDDCKTNEEYRQPEPRPIRNPPHPSCIKMEPYADVTPSGSPTNVFGRATRMDSTRFRKAGISAQADCKNNLVHLHRNLR